MHEPNAMQYYCEVLLRSRSQGAPPLPLPVVCCLYPPRRALWRHVTSLAFCPVAVVGGGISTEPRIQVDLIEGLQLFNTTYPGVTIIPGPHSFTPALSLSGGSREEDQSVRWVTGGGQSVRGVTGGGQSVRWVTGGGSVCQVGHGRYRLIRQVGYGRRARSELERRECLSLTAQSLALSGVRSLFLID